MQETLSCYSRFNSGRLFLNPETDYSHLELEMTRTASGMRVYINVLFLQAFPCPENPTYTKVDIQFEKEESQTVYAHLLNGNQRLLLPGDIADILIQALLEGRSFTITLGRNQNLIIPDHFEELYTKFLALPLDNSSQTQATIDCLGSSEEN